MESTSNQEREFACDDEASPRGVLEITVSGTESDRSSGSSGCSSSSPEKSSAASSSATAERPPLGREGYMPWKGMMDAFRINSVRRLTAIPLFASSYMISKKSLRKLARIRSAEDSIDLTSFPTKPSWKNFPYSELAAATDDFSPGMNHHIALFYFILNYFRFGVGRLCDIS